VIYAFHRTHEDVERQRFGLPIPLAIRKWAPETRVAIRVIHQSGGDELNSKSALFRIVRVRPEYPAISIGAQKLQPHSLWSLGVSRLN